MPITALPSSIGLGHWHGRKATAAPHVWLIAGITVLHGISILILILILRPTPLSPAPLPGRHIEPGRNVIEVAGEQAKW